MKLVEHDISDSDHEHVSTCTSTLYADNHFLNNPNNFVGGKISRFLSNWENITSDPWILNIIRGYRIEFEQLPRQCNIPKELIFNDEETIHVQQEIEKFLVKKIIQPAVETPFQYISNIFVRPKKDGSYRVILNLKHLNTDIEHHHFKMDTFQTALTYVSNNCWFGSVDLKDAYYSVNIDERDRKFLRFYWNNVLYEYTCMPNGLTTAPRIFTKILKVVFSELRKRGYINIGYIDDSLLVSQSYHECQKNINETVSLLDNLSFTIHPDNQFCNLLRLLFF